MKRMLVLLYGAVCYAVFLVTFLYLVGFVGNFGVPRSVDIGPATTPGIALLVNVFLLALFGIQHSIMARLEFKKHWTRLVPKSVERSTYVLISCAVLILLFLLWRPIPVVVWELQMVATQAIMWAVFYSGILLVLFSSFVIDHLDLFGLRQVWTKFKERDYVHPGFKVTYFYRFIRHPLYVGWILFFWATPEMTAGHLLLAASMTAYVLIAVHYEERDLVRFHGEDYVRYREKVPKLIPKFGNLYKTVKGTKGDRALRH